MSSLDPNGLLENIRNLAESYSDELSAQFRTLNLFVKHAGEIGRAHEVFLKGVISRFLPRKLSCGSGFVVTRGVVTRQQDIIIFDANRLPVLLEIGDCVVVDSASVAATIEVKTELDSNEKFEAAFKKSCELTQLNGNAWAVGLYAWEGLGERAALECYWRYLRADKLQTLCSCLPSFVYVRGKYLLVPNYDGRVETAPVLILRLGEGNHPEGAGLLSMIERLWISGVQNHAEWPWWIEAWGSQMNAAYSLVPWPSDLQRVADEISASTL